MPEKQGLPVLVFADPTEWEDWLAAHHDTDKGVWVTFAKKGSDAATVTYPEAVEIALCHGWIDGQAAGLDDSFWLQRFTPRGPRSKWSQINCARAERLIEAGRMRPAGHAAIEAARKDGRWDAAYAPPSTATVPPRSAGGAGRERGRGSVLRHAERHEPLRHPVPHRGRQATGDPGPPDQAVRRDAGPEGDDPPLAPRLADGHAGYAPGMPRPESDWEGVRLHVVSGKGGTGKTTVAAALALALAGQGHRVLLVEVEDRQGIAQLFDSPPLPYEERKVAVGPGGGDVYALAVDPEGALLEYLEMFYKLGRAGRGLRRIGAIDFATTIAPGMRDVLLTGKVYEAVRRRRNQGRTYDAVVLDAPPTGRIARFLGVNAEVAGLAKVGPIRGQADNIMGLLRSPLTAVHLVTVLEEMPVQETIDAAAELTEVGLPVGGVIINAVRVPLLRQAQLTAAAKGELDQREVAAGLKAAGVPAGQPVVQGLLAEAAEHAERVALEKAGRRRIKKMGRPTYELPFLPEGVDLGGLYELAEHLCRQGAA